MSCFSECIMAQSNRKWTLKILALPVFDDVFAQAILETPMADLAFVTAMDAGSGAQFVERVSQWSNVWDEKVVQDLFKDPSRLEQFWSLAISAEKVFLQSTVVQLGFGLCESSSTVTSLSPVAVLRKEAAIRALVNKPQAPGKRAKKSAQPESATPLHDQENAAKIKWATRLEAIGKRAGVHAKMFSEQAQSDDLSIGEMSRLRQLVLASGAPRTIAAHVRAFERFEIWADAFDVSVFPLSIDKLLKYALRLDSRECGPSVIPAFKTAVKWVAARLALELPDMGDLRLKALQDKVIADRAKMLKEAVAIPMQAVRALEKLVCSTSEPDQALVFCWWILCMIFASLRFDDATHVRPSELIMKDEGLFGVAWQTKVDRKRAGTRFIVPNVGFSQDPWLETGWELLQLFDSDRDYWVHELNTKDMFLERPPSYARTVQWMKVFFHRAVEADQTIAPSSRVVIANVVAQLTAHSCRVTMLDAAVHAGRSSAEVGLQANWKNPGPLVLKYTRNRSSVPATMIKELVNEMVKVDHPIQEDQDTVLDDAADHEVCGTEFFMKAASGRSYDYKFHVNSLGSLEVLACGKFPVSECCSVGSELPDIQVLCKACAKARPDVVCSYQQAVVQPQ